MIVRPMSSACGRFVIPQTRYATSRAMSETSEPKNEQPEADKARSIPPAPAPAAAAVSTPPPAAEPTLEEQLAAAKAEAAKNKEQWVRSAADFDNFRKRSRKEIEDARKGGREEFLREFLPVFDNLDRAMTSALKATEVKPVTDGLGMILKQFTDALSRSGITKVATVGSNFDPQVHEAIQQVESDEAPGTIVSEVQPGYVAGDRLIRAAMVVVAKPRAVPEPPPAEDDLAKTTEAAAAEPESTSPKAASTPPKAPSVSPKATEADADETKN
jgi:molecular chaperone GrpE